MSQYRIKRMIGKISNIILAIVFIGIVVVFLLGFGCSMVQILCVVLGIVLVIFLMWASVNWGDL